MVHPALAGPGARSRWSLDNAGDVRSRTRQRGAELRAPNRARVFLVPYDISGAELVWAPVQDARLHGPRREATGRVGKLEGAAIDDHPELPAVGYARDVVHPY